MAKIKKIFNILKYIIVLCLSISIVAGIILYGLSTKYYDVIPSNINYNEDFYKVDKELPIYIKKNVEKSDVFAELSRNGYELLPQNIKSVLNNRWKIAILPDEEVVENRKAQEFLSSMGQPVDGKQQFELGGYTSLQQKTVYLYVEENEDIIFMTTLMHEIGHCVAHEYGYLEKQDEFMTLWEKYQGKYIPCSSSSLASYANYDVMEFFATAFADYVLCSKSLSEKYPDIYEYMKNLETYPSTLTIVDEMKFTFKAMIKIMEEDKSETVDNSTSNSVQ